MLRYLTYAESHRKGDHESTIKKEGKDKHVTLSQCAPFPQRTHIINTQYAKDSVASSNPMMYSTCLSCTNSGHCGSMSILPPVGFHSSLGGFEAVSAMVLCEEEARLSVESDWPFADLFKVAG